MKLIIQSGLIFFSTMLFSQDVVKKINGIAFEFKQRFVDDTEQAQYIDLYRKNKKIITHITHKIEGDCSSENLELGAYLIKGNNIYFYSYWASGDAMQKNIYPFGFRKQIFKVEKSGNLIPISSVLYVESYVDSYHKPETIPYLNKKDKSVSETKKVRDYISKIEKEYNGEFILGKAKVKLEKEVRNILKEDIKENTKYWKEVYGTNYNK